MLLRSSDSEARQPTGVIWSSHRSAVPLPPPVPGPEQVTASAPARRRLRTRPEYGRFGTGSRRRRARRPRAREEVDDADEEAAARSWRSAMLVCLGLILACILGLCLYSLIGGQDDTSSSSTTAKRGHLASKSGPGSVRRVDVAPPEPPVVLEVPVKLPPGPQDLPEGEPQYRGAAAAAAAAAAVARDAGKAVAVLAEDAETAADDLHKLVAAEAARAAVGVAMQASRAAQTARRSADKLTPAESIREKFGLLKKDPGNLDEIRRVLEDREPGGVLDLASQGTSWVISHLELDRLLESVPTPHGAFVEEVAQLFREMRHAAEVQGMLRQRKIKRWQARYLREYVGHFSIWERQSWKKGFRCFRKHAPFEKQNLHDNFGNCWAHSTRNIINLRLAIMHSESSGGAREETGIQFVDLPQMHKTHWPSCKEDGGHVPLVFKRHCGGVRYFRDAGKIRAELLEYGPVCITLRGRGGVLHAVMLVGWTPKFWIIRDPHAPHEDRSLAFEKLPLLGIAIAPPKQNWRRWPGSIIFPF